MKEVFTTNFHILEEAPFRSKRAFLLGTFAPEREVYVIGASLGLLCLKVRKEEETFESYISASRSPELPPEDDIYFVTLKKDYIFYAQRDVYGEVKGIHELTKEVFFPDGHGVKCSRKQPLYIKVGYVNNLYYPMPYDAFINLYYCYVD